MQFGQMTFEQRNNVLNADAQSISYSDVPARDVSDFLPADQPSRLAVRSRAAGRFLPAHDVGGHRHDVNGHRVHLPLQQHVGEFGRRFVLILKKRKWASNKKQP